MRDTGDRPCRFHDDLQAALRERGYALRHVNLASLTGLRQQARQWYHQGVLGVLFMCFNEVHWIPQVDWSQFSVAMLGRATERMFIHTVMADAAREIAMALERVESSPARRIGVVLPRHEPAVWDDTLRRAVFMEFAGERLQGRVVPPLLIDFSSSETGWRYSFDDWIREQRPDLIIGLAVVRWLLDSLHPASPAEVAFYELSSDNPCPHSKHPGDWNADPESRLKTERWVAGGVESPARLG
jgi:DNA-binding LacI/PurR family transcriptional regulator